MAVLLKCGFALFFGRRLVVCDIGHVAFFLVAVVAFDGSVVDCFFHLKKWKNVPHQTLVVLIETYT